MPLLAVGWTLDIEMFFYVLFAGCLRIDRAKAPIFACVALVPLYLAEQAGLSDSRVLACYFFRVRHRRLLSLAIA
jgi:exopolysaccharide production protein ExoZ